MKRENIDRGWQFQLGKPSSIPGYGARTTTVDLPHDFMIESEVSPDAPGKQESGYFPGGLGTYTKYIDIPEDPLARYVLEIDGSYMHTAVSLNGHLLARHHYGYSPFTVDLTRFVKRGAANRLEIITDNEAQPSGRWYTGSGLYRHLNLLSSGRINIAPWGIYAYTENVAGGQTAVVVQAAVENHTGDYADLWVRFSFVPEGCDAATGDRVRVIVPAGESACARMRMLIPDAKIWDIDDPALYKICAELLSGDEIIDTADVLFGIRTVSVDAHNGFMLNGRSLKLKGGCVHHDNGILGAESYYDSEYRRMKIHKDNGYNAIRFAHNPMSSDLLEACDRLGLLVIDEFFDTWNMENNTHDFTGWFDKCWEQELENTVLRDRNHPSVVMWSIGNEISERGKLSDGALWSARLAGAVRRLDESRPVTSALCSFFKGLDDEDKGKFWQALYREASSNLGGGVLNLDNSYGRGIFLDYTEAYSAPLDVVGYNYMNYQYEESIKRFPNRVMCTTESKPAEFESYWASVLAYPQVIGDFLWTSHDYMGEAGIGKMMFVKPEEQQKAAMAMHMAEFPWRAAGAGDFDLLGFARPQSAYHRIVWGSDETYIAAFDPAHHDLVEIRGRYAWGGCSSSWSFPGFEGAPVKVEVYSAAEEVELFLNGESLGKAPAGPDNHLKAVFEITYEPGTLTAVSLCGGKEVSRDSVTTVGAPFSVKITPERTELSADGQSLSYCLVEIVDSKGDRVPYAEYALKAEVSGAGTLAAFGSARPKTAENYTTGEITTYEGRAMAIVRSGYEPGTITLTVNSDSLGADSCELCCG